jgi:FCD domain-containing protein
VIACLPTIGFTKQSLHPNPELRKITRDLKLRIHIVEAAYFRFENSERTVGQHQEIIEALQAGDMKKATELLATYWKQGLGESNETIFADWSMVRFASQPQVRSRIPAAPRCAL